MFDPREADAIGANLPWFTYGCDFGANAWQPRGGLADRGLSAEARLALDAAIAQGTTIVRWFLLCDGRSGLRFSGDEVVGLDDRLVDDIDAGLALAAAVGVRVVFVLFDFHWCLPARVESGVQLGGRRASIGRSRLRTELVDRVAAPLFARYGSHRTIAAWDLFNEPEWVTRWVGMANPLAGVSRGAMRHFLARLVERARGLVSQPLTVGLASARWLSLVDDLGLDFYQVHWYDRVERGRLPRPALELALERPIVLGEFPTAGSAYTSEAIVQHAAAAGYAGAWLWSILAEDAATDRTAVTRAVYAERQARSDRLDQGRTTTETRA